jgi:hypothetical protein
MPKEPKFIDLREYKPARRRDIAENSGHAKDLIEEINRRVRQFGFVPKDIIENLIVLGHDREATEQILTRIFIYQDKPENVAKQLAKDRVNSFWKTSISNVRILRLKRLKSTEIAKRFVAMAEGKGFLPLNMVEALIDLDYTPIEIILELRKIYIEQGTTPEQALEIAKDLYLAIKDKAVARKQFKLKQMQKKK